MTSDALLLVGREEGRARATLETHARRLLQREAIDEARVATYDVEPERDLREDVATVDADRVFAVPAAVAHTRDTLGALPGALSALDADVRYCEPLGRSPKLTDLLAERASAAAPGGAEATPDGTAASAHEPSAHEPSADEPSTDDPSADDPASIVLVGLGGATPHARQVVEFHATRLREREPVPEVVPCYLAQNPAVECARYDVIGERAVAVPLFLAHCEATRERIPEKLELDRGGIAYADPLGEHELVTDAIEAEVAKQRALAGPSSGPVSFEDALVAGATRLAADGEGRERRR